MNPTPEQERVLAATGERIPVAAGAGSGKTTLVVERIWRDVVDDGIDLGRLFIATYNRSAAAHLVTRIQKRFSDPDDGLPADRAALDVSSAWIGTFHALCARIVREHPFTAGVDPEFGELDEAEAVALQEQALDEAMAAVTHPGLMDMLANAGSSAPIRDAIVAVHERLRAAGHETPRLTVPEAGAPPTALEDEILRLADEAQRVGCRSDHEAQIALAKRLTSTHEAGAKAPRFNLNCRQALKATAEAFNERCAELWAMLLEDECRPQLQGFALALEAFADSYARAKKERGALDYEDLQLAALRILESGDHAYAFERVYVDEFQDANAVQDRIVRVLDADRTTIVGDGAQAIYGFRHASSDHFLASVGETPEHQLRDNHRSQPALMHALNGLLDGVMRGQPAFAPLEPKAPDLAGPVALRDEPVHVIAVTDADGKATREQEAVVVADEVAALLADGYRPRDVVVLFRAMTQVEPYRAALAARGIPIHLVAGSGFFTHDQVADLLSLLAVVENPHDEPALVRVLASHYVCASDADLVALRKAAGHKGALWPAVPAVPSLAPFVELRESLLPVLREEGLPALVEAAIGASGYDLAVLGLADGPRRFANMRRLVRLAERFAAVRGPDLRGFLATMSVLAGDRRLDPGEAVVVDPDLNAVRLATIHSVKGQEFPVVVLADASHGTPNSMPPVLVDSNGNAGLRAQRAQGENAEVLGYADLKDGATAEGRAEERRVLYVALTRAMRHVVVIGRPTQSGGEHTMFGITAEAAGTGMPGVRVEPRLAAAVSVPDRRPVPVAPPVTPVAPPVVAPPPEVDALAGARLSFSALGTFATCRRRFHLEYQLGLPGSSRRIDTGGTGATFGTEVGTLVHACLATHRWGGAPPDPGWAADLALGHGYDLPAEALDRAEAVVASVIGDSLAVRIAAGEPRAERPFAIEVDGVVLSGAIDLQVTEADGGVLLIDWKTHALAGRLVSDEMRHYELQRTVYGIAALRAGAPRVELTWLFTDALEDPQTRVVTAADLPELEREVAMALDALRNSDHAPAAEDPRYFCQGCPGLDAFCPVAGAPGS